VVSFRSWLWGFSKRNERTQDVLVFFVFLFSFQTVEKIFCFHFKPVEKDMYGERSDVIASTSKIVPKIKKI